MGFSETRHFLKNIQIFFSIHRLKLGWFVYLPSFLWIQSNFLTIFSADSLKFVVTHFSFIKKIRNLFKMFWIHKKCYFHSRNQQIKPNFARDFTDFLLGIGYFWKRKLAFFDSSLEFIFGFELVSHFKCGSRIQARCCWLKVR